jgi:transcription antitermination factor NusG
MGAFKQGTWDSLSGAVPGETVNTSAAVSGLHNQWYALQIRQRFEKKAATALRRKGIETFLPLLRQAHRWSDRRKIVEVPLFAGYEFVCVPLEAAIKLQVLQTPGVLGFAGSQHEPGAIPQSQIEALQRLLRSDANCALRPFLHAGQKVRIRGGALDGIEGILQENDRKNLVISIECIQRSLSVRIDGYSLELV